jgi:hypothetical protein
MQFNMNQNHPTAQNGTRGAGQATRRHWARILVSCAVVAAFAGVVGPGQSGQNPGMPKGTTISNNGAFPLPDANKQMELHQQQAKKQDFEMVNAERKKIIADESALLLKLATDLKTEVDKTNKDTLSINVIRKADTIEKLAHDVKEKMKLTVGAS